MRPLLSWCVSADAGISSYFSESETKVRLSASEVMVEVGEYDGWRMIWSCVGEPGGRPAEDQERRRLDFEPINGRQIGGGGVMEGREEN